MPVPAHQRANHERSDDALMTIRGLAFCLDTVRDRDPAPEPTSDAALAQAVVMSLLIEKVQDLEHLRRLEWVGLGGNSPGLSSEDVALALGEQAAPEKGAA